MCCASDNHNYMCHMCKRIVKFELQLSSYSQNIKFSRYCPKFHIFTNIVIFQVYLQLFRPTASSLLISWHGHVRNTLFHFCQLPPVKDQFWCFYYDSNYNILFLFPPFCRKHYNCNGRSLKVSQWCGQTLQ